MQQPDGAGAVGVQEAEVARAPQAFGQDVLQHQPKEIRAGLILIACSTTLVLASPAPSQLVQRCGWFDNPTPGNAWLYDRDGEWIIGIQGGHQASGNWPRFASSSHWVRTGRGNAGYGCTCMKVLADAESHEVARIVSARALALSVCRTDAAVKDLEPENPLK